MARSKSQNPSDESATNTPIEVRRRVTKACQRCRLKKCKCDGSSPCGRCKADDAICAYGKHKKSDKTVYRKGYVQMLERQHSQLIAGVHEMYKLLRKGEDWPTSMLGLLSRNDGQPLTHQILEALGVLHTLPQEDADDPDEQWQTFEHHPLDDGIVNTSTTTSPITHSLPPPQVQTPKQPAAPPRLMIAERRRSKFETDPLAMEQYNSAISPFTTSTPYLKQGPPFSANVAYTTQRHQESFPTPFSDQQLYDETITFGGNTPGKGDVMALDWTGVVDLFDSNPTMAESMQTG